MGVNGFNLNDIIGLKPIGRDVQDRGESLVNKSHLSKNKINQLQEKYLTPTFIDKLQIKSNLLPQIAYEYLPNSSKKHSWPKNKID